MERLVFPLSVSKSVNVNGIELTDGMPVLVDGQYRDEALWAGDYYADGPAAIKYLDKGAQIWRNSLLAIASKQYASGKLPSCVSKELKYRHLSPYIESYSLWWILASNEYLKRVNDPAFKEVMKIVTLRIINYFKRLAQSDLLLKMNWPHTDWNWTIIRQRKSGLANILWYEVLNIANELELPVFVDLEKFKANFDSTFWNDKEEAYMDGKVNQLDTNYLAIITGLASKTRAEKVLNAISKLETKYGRASFYGPATSFSSWHWNQVSPFLEYLHLKALLKIDKTIEARELYQKTLSEGLEISRKYGTDTVPEFWKNDGTLGSDPCLPHIKNQIVCVSVCTGWSTFGDYDPSI